MIRLSTTSRESYDDGQRATSADGDLDFERRRVVRSTLYAYLRYVRELSTNFTNSLSTVRTGGAINVSANCRFAFSFVRPPRSSRFLPRIIAGERLLLQVYVPYFAPLLLLVPLLSAHRLPAGIFFFLLFLRSSSFPLLRSVRPKQCVQSLKLLLPLAMFRIHGIATFPAWMTSGLPRSSAEKKPSLVESVS